MIHDKGEKEKEKKTKDRKDSDVLLLHLQRCRVRSRGGMNGQRRTPETLPLYTYINTDGDPTVNHISYTKIT